LFILVHPETAIHEIHIPDTTLNDGRTMPVLGLGAYELNGLAGPQVVLRWNIQSGTVPLPKSSTPERQTENMNVFNFELCDADMAAINALACPDGRLKGQDPVVYEEF
jgi:diketogulonate reductase-like aldo/keto reductase